MIMVFDHEFQAPARELNSQTKCGWSQNVTITNDRTVPHARTVQVVPVAECENDPFAFGASHNFGVVLVYW